MRPGITFFLKIAVILMGIPILALCIFWLPGAVNYLPYPILAGVYETAIFFFLALHQALWLLGDFDRNVAFSEQSVREKQKTFGFRHRRLYARC